MSFAPIVTELQAALAPLLPEARRFGLAAAGAWNVLVVAHLRRVLTELALARGSSPELLSSGRLFRDVPGFEASTLTQPRRALLETLQTQALPWVADEWRARPLEAFGQLYEALLAARPRDGALPNLRKATGSYYTPEPLTRVVAERAFSALESARGGSSLAQPLRILDPALGAGAFLVQSGRQLGQRSGRALEDVVKSELFGVDVSPLAVAVAEASLWLLAGSRALPLAEAGRHLYEADSLCSPTVAGALGRTGMDWSPFQASGGFDLAIGNPPWVAYAGRATQPLPDELRAYYRENFRAFSGYPTLHGLFVELCAKLAPRGVIALLIPSPVADLAGYRHVRAAVSARHQAQEPLLELGQDAFESVTQPCFALVAAPRRDAESDLERPFVLSERGRAAARASEVRVPAALERLQALPRLPAELFGEMGFQTSSRVTRELLYRGESPPPEHSYPLLEGRDVVEFRVREARLFLKPDSAVLAACRCRLRDASAYASVKIVVRQTAAIPIAARHTGAPFRNSLLAGFERPDFSAELVLGLLNSQLYRALHLAARRDARQTTFPQVKVAHLRALPAPPRRSPACGEIARLAASATRDGLSAELRRALDAAVFDEFRISPREAEEIAGFVKQRSPRAGLAAPLD